MVEQPRRASIAMVSIPVASRRALNWFAEVCTALTVNSQQLTVELLASSTSKGVAHDASPWARSGAPKLSADWPETSLREQALHALRNALTSGDIAPGTHLVETELSEALAISRGTLREALRQLEQEGLVEAGERGRLKARTLHDHEIAQMFQVRAALEGLAAELLCRIEDRTRGGRRAGRRPAGDDRRVGRRARARRGRPRLPPPALRAQRQRRTGAELGHDRRLHPDVDHVRRHWSAR